MGKQTVKIEKMNNNLFKISSLLIPNTNLTLEESGKIIEQFPPLLVNFNHRQCVECSSEFKRLQKWTKKNFKKYVENEKMKEKEKYETLNVPKNIKICISQDKDNIYIKSLKLPDIWLIVYLDKQKVGDYFDFFFNFDYESSKRYIEKERFYEFARLINWVKRNTKKLNDFAAK